MIAIAGSGHGFETEGKESEGFYDDKHRVLLKENSVNEAVCNKLSMLFFKNKKEFHFITNEWYDVSLNERIRREKKIAKQIRKQGKEPLFISIHADAFHVKNKAVGGRFFYYSDKGKVIAEKMTNYLRVNGYDLPLREPMQKSFKMIRETSSTAVLFEMGFMTSKPDLTEMLKDAFRNKTAMLLYEIINKL